MNSGRMKTIYEFLQKVAYFSLSRCLPIEGIFLSQDNFNDFDSVYKRETLAGKQEHNLAPRWHEVENRVVWVKLTHTKSKILHT